jgi:quercetin dioxygenase-like cupin family protein
MTDGAQDWTHGSDERGARPMVEGLMAFDLADELANLRAEPLWRDRDRDSRTLLKTDDLRVVLTSLRAGATIAEQDGEGPVSVHVLEGGVSLRSEEGDLALGPGELAIVAGASPWQLSADQDAAVLLTFAWNREAAADQAASAGQAPSDVQGADAPVAG